MKFLIYRDIVVGFSSALRCIFLLIFFLSVSTANAQANTVFTDASLNPKNVISFGNAKINAGESKFGGLVGSFDGDGDYLSVAPNPLPSTTKLLTIEAWIYLESLPANGWPLVSQNVNTINGEQQFFVSGSNGGVANQNKLRFSRGAGVSNPIDLIGATMLPLNQWVHVAVSVDGTTAKLFVNGNLDASVATTVGWVGTDQPFYVATTLNPSAPQNQSYAQGKISDLRITKDSSRYKTPFIPHAAQSIDSSNTYDPDWPNNSLLITANEKNGSTNFIDLSPIPKKLTVNGNVQISTVQSKFGGSSVYFDGSGDYFSIPAHTDFQFGANDFTIEAWINFESVPKAGEYAAIIGNRSNQSNNNQFSVFYGATEKFFFYYSINGTAQIAVIPAGQMAAIANTWYHIALVRNKDSINLYVNGVRVANANVGTSSLYPSTANLLLGAAGYSSPAINYYFRGFMDDIRVSNGIARYLVNFTPAEVPPVPPRMGDSQWPKVSLLLNANGANNTAAFTDLSIFPKTITPSGDAKINTAQSKFGGSSVLFDGNGDYLTVPVNADLQFGAGDFTIESWIRPNSFPGGTFYPTILAQRTTNANGYAFTFLFNSTGTTIGFYWSANGASSIGIAGSYTFAINTWYHIATVRSGSVITIYVNGVAVKSGPISGAIFNSSAPIRIGAFDNPVYALSYFNGSIDDLRITKGVARYTSDFTPPTIQSEPARFVKDPYGSHVSLLLMNETSPVNEDFPFVLSATKNISSDLSLEGVIARFSSPMEATSMLTSQVSVTDSTQKIYPVNSVTQINESEFEFKFSPTLLAGTYNFKMWPDTLGVNGLPLDQNNNGVGGEVGDAYIGTIVVENALPKPVVITANPEGSGTGTNVSLAWSGYATNLNGRAITSFRIYSSLNSYTDISQATLLKEVAGSITSTNLDGLLNNTTHYITVVAVDTAGAFISQASPLAVKPVSVAEQSISYTYNAAGQILTEDGPRTDVNDITTYTYDTNGNRATMTNARGHLVRYTSYDGMGRLLSMTDVNGIVSEFTYHDRGWLLSSRIKHPSNSSLNTVTTYTYDPVGLMIGMTLPNGYQLTYEYDGARRLTAIQNAAGERIEYTVDAAGNRTQQTIKNNTGTIVYSVAQAFDELSRVMAVTGNNGQNEKHQYDANDNTTAITDGRNNKTQQTYDALNRVAKIIDPNLKETQFTYDSQDRIKTVTDARGNTTTYSYDGLGNLISQSSPDTGITHFSYDAAGNRSSAVDARGVVVNYTYDALNRLTLVEYPASPTENVAYTYDGNANGSYGVGKLTGVMNSGASVSYSYNHLGLISQKRSVSNEINALTEYAYDTSGNLISITYPSGRIVSYVRDAAGRVQTVKTKASALAAEQNVISSIAYLPFGPAKSYTFGNGLSHAVSFDTDYRITAINVGVLARNYEYDNADNINKIADSLATSKTQNFTYDPLNRLVSANGGYGYQAFSYDAVGNRTGLLFDNGATILSDTYNYEASSNRLSSINKTAGGLASGVRNFVYDEAGNRIQGTAEDGNAQSFSYNNANRLSSANVSGSVVGTYSYNALGQRISKTYADNSKELFHYDEAGQLIAVTNAAGIVQREYIYNGNQLVGFVNTPNSTPIPPVTLTAASASFQGAHVLATNNTGYTGATGFIDYVGEGQANWELNLPASANYTVAVRYSMVGSNRPLALLIDGVQKATVNFTPTSNLNTWSVATAVINIPAGTHSLSLKTTGASGPNVDKVDISSVEQSTASEPVTLPAAHASFQGAHVLATNNTGYTGATGFIDYVGEGQADWQLNLSTSANYTVAVRYSMVGSNRPLALLIDGIQKATINFTPTSNLNTWSVATAVINIPAGTHSLSLKTTGASGPNVDRVDISSVEQNTGGEPSLYFIHNDHLTTPQVVTNQSQSVVWVADYEPFGKAKLGLLNSINVDSRFPGQYLDSETGLYYNYFRDYDPSIGRYIQSDPIGLAGGINTYAYVEGNPLKGIDPLGLIVNGTYCQDTGVLTLRDQTTGQILYMMGESGGKPWGDSIPQGNYEILEQAQREGFFRLDPLDENPRDDTHEPSGRNHFRLHKPGRTLGCIAAQDEEMWNDVKKMISNTSTQIVNDNFKPYFWTPDSNIKKYGNLVVRKCK